MISVFNGSSADNIWMQLVKEFQRPGVARIQSSRNGKTKEILHVAISISDPKQRWVMSRQPAINPAFALAEVVWIMNGRRDLAFLKFWNKNYQNFVGSGPDLHGAYGYRLRHHLGLDQLERAYQTLDHNSDTRQVVLQIWDSRIDMPEPSGTPVNEDIPCNVISMPKVRDGKLEWSQIIRSNDLFLGLPHNLVQFTSIQEIIAGWLNIECGTYNQISDSLHVYEYDEENIRKSLPSAQAILNTDSLALPRKESELVWKELEFRVERMITEDLKENELIALSRWNTSPQAYQNILAVLTAEAARRHEWTDMADEIMATVCTNPAFKYLWTEWLQRLNSGSTSEMKNGKLSQKRR